MVEDLRTMTGRKMHRLNDEFLRALKNGVLSALTDAVRSDTGLCLELRGAYINIYYRGGSLMKVEQSTKGYDICFNEEYFKGGNVISLPNSTDIDAWLDALPKLKQAIDQYQRKKSQDEREYQQLILRDNNFGSIARSTDYYICDIEYQSRDGRFDMIAVHWPAKKRKNPDNRRLIIVEVKYGEEALKRRAGLHDHIKDVNKYRNKQLEA